MKAKSKLRDVVDPKSLQALESLGFSTAPKPDPKPEVSLLDLPIEQLAEALTDPEVQARLKAMGGLEDNHNYDQQPVRMPRFATGQRRYLVLNGEGRALKATNNKQEAEHLASLSPSRKIVDWDATSKWQRLAISRILAMPASRSSLGQYPRVPPPPLPKAPSKPHDQLEQTLALINELASEVSKLALPPEDHRILLQTAVKVALLTDREQALDLIYESSLLYYTAVYDKQTEEIIAEFDTAAEAQALAKVLNDSPDGRFNPKEAVSVRFPTSALRYKCVIPGAKA